MCPPLIKHFPFLLGNKNSYFLPKSPLPVRCVSLGYCLATSCLVSHTHSCHHMVFPLSSKCSVRQKSSSSVHSAGEQKEQSPLFDSHFSPCLWHNVPSAFHQLNLQSSLDSAHSNPLCDKGLSVKLVLKRCLLKQRLQISTLAPSGGTHHSQKCWQQHLKVALVNLPTAGKYWLLWLAVNFSWHIGGEVQSV